MASVVLLFLTTPPPASADITTSRKIVHLSQTPEGQSGNGPSVESSISAAGTQVAFASDASNLVANDENQATDIFLYVQGESELARASVDQHGNEGNAGSFGPSPAADGSSLAFLSWATNLRPDDTNGAIDVFVKNMHTGEVTIVSRNPVDDKGHGHTNFLTRPAVAATGQSVAYSSDASELLAGDENGVEDVYVFDLSAHSLTRASVTPAGVAGNNWSVEPAISSNGRYIAFTSAASDLAPGDSNDATDIFVRDLALGMTSRISVSSTGSQSNGPSYSPSISGDGRHIAFQSYASDLVPGDLNGEADIFVRDIVAGITTRVSWAANGGEPNGPSYRPVLSSSGEYVAFASSASNLSALDFNGASDVFRYARASGESEIISVGPEGVPVESGSYWPSISADGRDITFHSAALLVGLRNFSGHSGVFLSTTQTRC